MLRGCWFEVSGDKWWPFQEEDYARIEEEHLKMDWRRMVTWEREGESGGAISKDSSCWTTGFPRVCGPPLESWVYQSL